MNEHLNIEEFYRGLDALFAEKQTGEVTGYLEDWLQKAENAGDIPAIIAVSNELGGICRVTGKIDRAKELYATVLTLLEESGMADTENYATALINTGDVYIFNREQEKALECFLAAKDMLESLGFTKDYRMAALCNNISMVYRDNGSLDKAEAALDTAFDIISSMPGCSPGSTTIRDA